VVADALFHVFRFIERKSLLRINHSVILTYIISRAVSKLSCSTSRISAFEWDRPTSV